jgi:hypothetical protein
MSDLSAHDKNLDSLENQYIIHKFGWKIFCSLMATSVVLIYAIVLIGMVVKSGGVHKLYWFLNNNPGELTDLSWFFIVVLAGAVVLVGLSYIILFRPATTAIKNKVVDQYKETVKKSGKNTVIPGTAFDGFLVKANYRYKELSFLERFNMSL